MSAPAPLARWLALVRPPLGSMVVTTVLQDGSAGDTGTGVSNSDSVSFGEGCAMHEVSANLTAALSWDCPVQVGTATAYYDLAEGLGDNQLCALPLEWPGPPEGGAYEVTLERSLDGSTWIVVPGTPAFTSNSYTWTVSAAVRHLRLVFHTWSRRYDQNDTYTATVSLTDFRATATLLAPTDPPANLRGVGACEGAQLTWLWDPCGCCAGYEVQADGGAIEDVGADTTYVLTPVTVSSTHTLKVRGYNAGGAGPWAELELTSCTADTDPPPDPDPEENGCECAWEPTGSTPTTWRKAGCA